jgi:hypothetical protein
MVVDHEKWHDGIGYDIDALKEATPEERKAIETMLLGRGVKDWRYMESLAELGGPAADRILEAALEVRYAPRLVPESKRVASLGRALETAALYGGLLRRWTKSRSSIRSQLWMRYSTGFETRRRDCGSLRGDADVRAWQSEQSIRLGAAAFFLRFNTGSQGRTQSGVPGTVSEDRSGSRGISVSRAEETGKSLVETSGSRAEHDRGVACGPGVRPTSAKLRCLG